MTSFLDALARVLPRYPFDACELLLLQGRPESAKSTWKVDTERGAIVLKRVDLSPERLAFMTYAMECLGERGAAVPRLIPTLDGELSVTRDDFSFVACEWIEGRRARYRAAADRRAVARALARFHLASRDVPVRSGASVRCRLGGWRDDYRRQRRRLESCRAEVAARGPRDDYDRLFLKQVDGCLDQASRADSLLTELGYDEQCRKARARPALCHWDPGSTNFLVAPSGEAHLVDMDTLTVDLTAVDLVKLANKLMRSRGRWEEAVLLELLRTYQEIAPLTIDSLGLVLAHLYFPHLFAEQALKHYRRRAKKHPHGVRWRRFRNVCRLEQSKRPILDDCLARRHEFARGDGG